MSEFYEEKINTTRDYGDRYKNCKILVDKESGEVLLSTREIVDFPESTSDSYHRVESYELNRLDLIAYKYYNNPSFWWIIAQANDITDPFSEMTPGMLLRIPYITTLYGNRGVLL